MRGAGVRIEAMRFALLIVLTVALASVAVRINSHSSPSASRVHPSTAAPDRSGAAPVAPAAPTTTPTRPTRGSPHQPRTAAAGGGVGAGGSGRTVAQLPVTGWDATWKLGALAFVLIGGGTLAIGAAGRRREPQPVTVQD